MQQLYKIWRGTAPGEGVGINEDCLMSVDGDYVGVVTGTLYPKDSHYHSPLHKAVIISVDQENLTGMMHLSEADSIFGINKKEYKARYIGCCITVSKVHLFNDVQIYYCTELKEYFSQNELSVDGSPITIL